MHSECFRTLEMNIASSPISMPSGKKILLFFIRLALNSLEWGSEYTKYPFFMKLAMPAFCK